MAWYRIAENVLNAIANAINAKTGRTAPMTPVDMVSEIQSIQTGGGDPYQFFSVYSNNAMTQLVDDNIPKTRPYSFSHYHSLTKVFLKECQLMGERSFEVCNYLATVVLVNANNNAINIGNTTFVDCGTLSSVDLSNASSVTSNVFLRCPVSTLIIRMNAVCPLASIQSAGSIFQNGSGGVLYVPQALISAYQSATNWSTVLTTGTNQILPIEGSIYETQYVDGTPIPSA